MRATAPDRLLTGASDPIGKRLLPVPSAPASSRVHAKAELRADWQLRPRDRRRLARPQSTPRRAQVVAVACPFLAKGSGPARLLRLCHRQPASPPISCPLRTSWGRAAAVSAATPDQLWKSSAAALRSRPARASAADGGGAVNRGELAAADAAGWSISVAAFSSAGAGSGSSATALVLVAVLVMLAWTASLRRADLGPWRASVEVARLLLEAWWVATFWLGCLAAYACGRGVSCSAAVVADA